MLYFARWIERAIPGTDVLLEPVGTGSATDAAGLCAVTFTTAMGELFMGLADSATLTVRAGEKTYSSPLPPVSEETLMREELSILGRDPAFERVLL